VQKLHGTSNNGQNPETDESCVIIEYSHLPIKLTCKY